MRKVKSTLFQDLDAVAVVLRALSNASRLRITMALLDTELSVATLEEMLEIKQPNLSQQLAELRKAGILQARRSAKSVFYSIADPGVNAIIALISASLGSTGQGTIEKSDKPDRSGRIDKAGKMEAPITSPVKPLVLPIAAAHSTKIWQGEEAQFAQVSWPRRDDQRRQD